MKIGSFILMCLIFSIYGHTQEPATNSLAIGYQGNVAIQPGVGIHWTHQVNPSSGLIWLAGITSYGVHQSYLNFFGHGGVGIQLPKKTKRWSNSFSAGLGYQFRLKVTDVTINLSSGEVDLKRESSSFLGPVVSYQLTAMVSKSLATFLQLTFFRAFGLGEALPDNALFLGLGVRYTLPKKDK